MSDRRSAERVAEYLDDKVFKKNNSKKSELAPLAKDDTHVYNSKIRKL